ncbi:MAG: flagellar hook-associated protein FlgK, partial [Gammaproteobacteria bacterium]|nr:flagellar hook-associated protein FlgK [Gammaproteobacteria bacterium]
GYLAQTLEFSFRDPATGQLTNQTVNLGPDGLSARDMATALNTVSGVSANAYTTLGLRFGTPPVTPVDFSVTVGGTTLTLTNVQPDAMRPENLADEINANPDFKDLGVVASIDGNQLVIRSIHGDDISVGFPATGGGTFFLNKDPYGNGTGVIDQPVVAGTTYVVGGVVDISLAEGALVRPQDMDLGGTGELFALNPTAQLTYRGIQFDISGSPAGGDTFGIHFNSAGVSDNRNGLNLAGLANSLTLQGGLSFNGAYNDLVGNVGTLTNQARMDQEAGQVLLSQSETQWQQKSGVNLDEEAGRLIQYQAAYNASAQVVSIARDLFDTLINTFR